MLWRPHMESDQLLRIEQGGKAETVAFVVGANFRKWPTETIPVQYGVDYRLSGAGLAAPVTVRFAALDAMPEAADGAAEMLMAKGCTPQLDRLVEDRKSTRLNSSHNCAHRMTSSALKKKHTHY